MAEDLARQFRNAYQQAPDPRRKLRVAKDSLAKLHEILYRNWKKVNFINDKILIQTLVDGLGYTIEQLEELRDILVEGKDPQYIAAVLARCHPAIRALHLASLLVETKDDQQANKFFNYMYWCQEYLRLAKQNFPPYCY